MIEGFIKLMNPRGDGEEGEINCMNFTHTNIKSCVFLIFNLTGMTKTLKEMERMCPMHILDSTLQLFVYTSCSRAVYQTGNQSSSGMVIELIFVL